MTLPSQPAKSPPTLSSSERGLFAHFQQDLLSSLVVFLVALPLCMGIALASGAPVATGLISGIIGGIAVGALAGAPLLVSGPAAGLTVICAEAIRHHGLAGFGLAVLMAGAVQLLAGIFHLGQWFRAVSPAVIHGMLSGIGILIFTSQLHVLVDGRPRENALKNIAAIPESLSKVVSYSGWEDAPARAARIELLMKFNSLFNQQRSLQRNLERTLGRLAERSPEQSSSPLPEEIGTLQKSLSEQMEHAMAIATASPLIQKSGDASVKLQTMLQASSDALRAAWKELDQHAASPRDHQAMLQASQKVAVSTLENLLQSIKRQDWAGKLGVLAIGVILLWQKLARGRLKIVPAPLLAILLATAIAQGFSLPLLYVDVPDNLLEGVTFPSLQLLSEVNLRAIFVSAIVVAVIASAETLLAATAVDQMHRGPRARYDKELAAQGVGNMLCGLVGALPMTGVIVRSAANVQAGARSRLSTILHGIWLLLFSWAMTFVLRMIPTSALAGILVYTGFRLIDFKGFRRLWREHRSEAVIFLVTIVVILVEDLLVGVATGIVLSAIKLLWNFSRLDVRYSEKHEGGGPVRATLRLSGAATFLRIPPLASALERTPPGAELHVDLAELDSIDHAVLELLINWAKQHESTGGKLVMDWETLHAQFGKR